MLILLWITCYFYPRPPRGGRPVPAGPKAQATAISIHALREEGDYTFPGLCYRTAYFYPRPPRGGRLQLTNGKRAAIPISIHALREEGDRHLRKARPAGHISIHALREEGDDKIILDTLTIAKFLSTPSARRATEWRNRSRVGQGISIHALREEGDGPFYEKIQNWVKISIHALREEGDSKNRDKISIFL